MYTKKMKTKVIRTTHVVTVTAKSPGGDGVLGVIKDLQNVPATAKLVDIDAEVDTPDQISLVFEEELEEQLEV